MNTDTYLSILIVDSAFSCRFFQEHIKHRLAFVASMERYLPGLYGSAINNNNNNNNHITEFMS